MMECEVESANEDLRRSRRAISLSHQSTGENGCPNSPRRSQQTIFGTACKPFRYTADLRVFPELTQLTSVFKDKTGYITRYKITSVASSKICAMDIEDSQVSIHDIDVELSKGFIPPSVSQRHELSAHPSESYTYHSPLPKTVDTRRGPQPCILGVDEAGRGPVLGYHPSSSR